MHKGRCIETSKTWSLDSYCQIELSFPLIVMFSLSSKLCTLYSLDHICPFCAWLLCIFQSQHKHYFFWGNFFDPAYALEAGLCHHGNLCYHYPKDCKPFWSKACLSLPLVSLPRRVDANRYLLKEQIKEWVTVWLKGQASSISVTDHLCIFATMVTLFQLNGKFF